MAELAQARASGGTVVGLGASALVLLLCRILLSAIFFIAFIRQLTDFSLFTHYMTSFHVPAPLVLLPLAMILEIVCTVLLVVGIFARWAALAFACFTLLLALIFHRFWAVPAHELQAQLNLFLFHMAMIGGMLYVTTLGPGPLSIDHLFLRKRG